MPDCYVILLKFYDFDVDFVAKDGKQWWPGVFLQGGPAAKWRPFKSNIVIKSLTSLAAPCNFLIFLMVFFDTFDLVQG